MISIPQGREFQAQTMTGMGMPHYGFGPNLSFLDQKIKVDLCSHPS